MCFVGMLAGGPSHNIGELDSSPVNWERRKCTRSSEPLQLVKRARKENMASSSKVVESTSGHGERGGGLKAPKLEFGEDLSGLLDVEEGQVNVIDDDSVRCEELRCDVAKEAELSFEDSHVDSYPPLNSKGGEEGDPWEGVDETLAAYCFSSEKQREGHLPWGATMVALEPQFEDNASLLEFWATGSKGLTAWRTNCNSRNLVTERLRELEEEEREYVCQVRRKEEDRIECIPLPLPPPVPTVEPGLYLLSGISGGMTVPWTWECHSVGEFMKMWEESFTTDCFLTALYRIWGWWHASKKHEPKLEASVKESITSAFEALGESIRTGKPYSQLKELGDHMEYLLGRRRWEGEKKRYEDAIRLREGEIERAVVAARKKFNDSKGVEKEAAVWNWCPLWHAITGVPSFRACLPPMPFRHDAAEAKMVHRLLIKRRKEKMHPMPLIFLLRMVFDGSYGCFRLLSCPTFGLHSDLVISLCTHGAEIRRALSRFMVDGRFMFAGMPDITEADLEKEVMDKVEAVRDGRGQLVLDAIDEWVHTVQLRALQDIAILHPDVFQSMWCTRAIVNWDQHWRLWENFLAEREKIDLGWVLGPSWRPSSASVCKLKKSLLRMIQDITTETAREDDERWKVGSHP